MSETVFLLPAEDGDARMPIFSPAAELAFAGHPDLGTAFVAAEARQLTSVQLETAAAAAPLKLTRSRQHGGSADDIGQITFAWMRQPILAWAPFPRTAQLLAALGIPASGLPVEPYTNGPTHVYVVYRPEATYHRASWLRRSVRVLFRGQPRAAGRRIRTLAACGSVQGQIVAQLRSWPGGEVARL